MRHTVALLLLFIVASLISARSEQPLGTAGGQHIVSSLTRVARTKRARKGTMDHMNNHSGVLLATGGACNSTSAMNLSKVQHPATCHTSSSVSVTSHSAQVVFSAFLPCSLHPPSHPSSRPPFFPAENSGPDCTHKHTHTHAHTHTHTHTHTRAERHQ